MPGTIVVCGATGHQGGAVVRQLLSSGGWDVVALSRNPESTAAAALGRAGARLVGGDLMDRRSLREAFHGAHGVFGVTQPWSPDYKTCDVAGEIRQGRHIVDAAVESGVRHLVLSTVMLLGPGKTGVPHVDSKLDIEAYARAATPSMTIVRPAQFMDNIGSRFFPVKPGRVRGFVDGDAKVPYVACADIGGVVTIAFRDRLVGREIDAVGDFVSGVEISSILGRIYGRRFRYSAPPALAMRLFAREFYVMRRAFERHGRPPYQPEIAGYVEAMRRLWPTTMTMETFLRQRKPLG